MLYIFKVVDSPFFKFGFTDQINPWSRIQKEFWTNVHPPELCQKFNPENLKLIFLFEEDETDVEEPPPCPIHLMR